MLNILVLLTHNLRYPYFIKKLKILNFILFQITNFNCSISWNIFLLSITTSFSSFHLTHFYFAADLAIKDYLQ